MRNRGLSKNQVALMTMQWSLMMSSGVDIVRALDTLERSTRDEREAGLFSRVRQRLMEGNYLSRALSEFPTCFSPLYLALIQVGEVTGGLARVMERLADWLRRDGDLTRRVHGALLYPFLVLAVGLLLIVTVFATVLPGLAQMLEESEAVLPWYSQLTMALVAAIRTPIFWVVLSTLIMAVVAVLRERLSCDAGRRQLYELGMHIPVFGDLLAGSALARFSTAAAFMLEVGIDISRTLRLAAATSGSPILQDEIDQVVHGLHEGESLAELFSHLSHAPPMLWRMTQVGEEAARMPAVFKSLAGHFESEVEFRIEAMLALMEPLLMMLLAGMVGFTAVSVMVPLYGTLSNLC
ncbi:type II secretion system F family protein [bacterium]|nr:type II secretion system F family protein [bacterium]